MKRVIIIVTALFITISSFAQRPGASPAKGIGKILGTIVDAFYSQLEGQIVGVDGISATATNGGWNYGGRLMTQLQLNNGWSLQGFRGGFGMYALGFNKDFNNGKGSIGLAPAPQSNNRKNKKSEKK